MWFFPAIFLCIHHKSWALNLGIQASRELLLAAIRSIRIEVCRRWIGIGLDFRWVHGNRNSVLLGIASVPQEKQISAGSFASGGVNVLPSRKVPRFLVSAGLIALPITSRTRLLITAAVLCHLLLAPRLVTSQLHPTSPEHRNLPEAPRESSQPVTIQALQQEKDGPVYKHAATSKSTMRPTRFLRTRSLTTLIPETSRAKVTYCSRVGPMTSTSRPRVANTT